MSAAGLDEFRDRYWSLAVTACEWRAMHADPERMATQVFEALAADPEQPNLRLTYRLIDKTVMNAYTEAVGTRSIFDQLRGQKQTVPNEPQDSDEEAKLRKAVARLRRRDRDLLQRAYWDELSESELAEVEGCDLTEVLTRRDRALENYRRLLARLSPASDPDAASKLLRSIKPGIRTRWE